MTTPAGLIQRLEELRLAASQGEWRAEIDNVFAGPQDHSVYVADCMPLGGPAEGTPIARANAAYIVASCNAVPSLIAAARALEGLLSACEIDFGVPDENDGDDEAVAASLEGDCAVKFGMMRRAREALANLEKVG